MDTNKETLEQIEQLLSGVENKELLLRQLVIRNSKDLFSFISQIKTAQDRGYYFGVLHSQYENYFPKKEEFLSACEQYQYAETECGFDFYKDFEKFMEEEVDCLLND